MKAILKLALGLLAFALIVLVCRSAYGADFAIEIPEGTTDVDAVVIYPFERPVRIMGERAMFRDGFE